MPHHVAGLVLHRDHIRGIADFNPARQIVLAPDQAQAWSALAHLIGRGLRYGLLEPARAPSGAPRLF